MTTLHNQNSDVDPENCEDLNRRDFVQNLGTSLLALSLLPSSPIQAEGSSTKTTKTAVDSALMKLIRDKPLARISVLTRHTLENVGKDPEKARRVYRATLHSLVQLNAWRDKIQAEQNADQRKEMKHKAVQAVALGVCGSAKLDPHEFSSICWEATKIERNAQRENDRVSRVEKVVSLFSAMASRVGSAPKWVGDIGLALEVNGVIKDDQWFQDNFAKENKERYGDSAFDMLTYELTALRVGLEIGLDIDSQIKLGPMLDEVHHQKDVLQYLDGDYQPDEEELLRLIPEDTRYLAAKASDGLLHLDDVKDISRKISGAQPAVPQPQQDLLDYDKQLAESAAFKEYLNDSKLLERFRDAETSEKARILANYTQYSEAVATYKDTRQARENAYASAKLLGAIGRATNSREVQTLGAAISGITEISELRIRARISKNAPFDTRGMSQAACALNSVAIGLNFISLVESFGKPDPVMESLGMVLEELRELRTEILEGLHTIQKQITDVYELLVDTYQEVVDSRHFNENQFRKIDRLLSKSIKDSHVFDRQERDALYSKAALKFYLSVERQGKSLQGREQFYSDATIDFAERSRTDAYSYSFCGKPDQGSLTGLTLQDEIKTLGHTPYSTGLLPLATQTVQSPSPAEIELNVNLAPSLPNLLIFAEGCRTFLAAMALTPEMDYNLYDNLLLDLRDKAKKAKSIVITELSSKRFTDLAESYRAWGERFSAEVEQKAIAYEKDHWKIQPSGFGFGGLEKHFKRIPIGNLAFGAGKSLSAKNKVADATEFIFLCHDNKSGAIDPYNALSYPTPPKNGLPQSHNPLSLAVSLGIIKEEGFGKRIVTYTIVKGPLADPEQPFRLKCRPFGTQPSGAFVDPLTIEYKIPFFNGKKQTLSADPTVPYSYMNIAQTAILMYRRQLIGSFAAELREKYDEDLVSNPVVRNFNSFAASASLLSAHGEWRKGLNPAVLPAGTLVLDAENLVEKFSPEADLLPFDNASFFFAPDITTTSLVKFTGFKEPEHKTRQYAPLSDDEMISFPEIVRKAMMARVEQVANSIESLSVGMPEKTSFPILEQTLTSIEGMIDLRKT